MTKFDETVEHLADNAIENIDDWILEELSKSENAEFDSEKLSDAIYKRIRATLRGRK